MLCSYLYNLLSLCGLLSSGGFLCVCKSESIDDVSCCWLTGRVFRSLGCWVWVIKLVRNLDYLDKAKLNSASAVTIGWWWLLLEYHFASLQQKDGSVVCTWVSTSGLAGVVCAGGWAAGASDRDTGEGLACSSTGSGSRVVEEMMEVGACAVLFSLLSQPWPMFLCINSMGRCGLLSGWQYKSLGCSVCMLMERCEELLNSRMHKGQDADKVYSLRSLFFGAESREECRKELPRARQWVLAGGRQEAWMSPSVYTGWLEQNKEISHAFLLINF